MKWMRPLAASAVILLTSNAWGFQVQLVAGKDLAKVVESYIAAHPQEAEAYFCLGRVCIMSWAAGDKEVEVAGKGNDKELPRFVPWGTVMIRRGMQNEPPGPYQIVRPLMRPQTDAVEVTQENARMLARSVEAYRRAIALDNQNPRYHLALGCALEEMGIAALHLPADYDWSFGEKKKLSDKDREHAAAALANLGDAEMKVRDQSSQTLLDLMPLVTGDLAACKTEDPEVKARLEEAVRMYWRSQAIAEYRKAFAATVKQDLALKMLDDVNDAVISAEAGERLLILLAAVPQAADKGESQTLRDALEELRHKPHMGHAY